MEQYQEKQFVDISKHIWNIAASVSGHQRSHKAHQAGHLYFLIANLITHCHSMLLLLWNIIELTEDQISVSLRNPSLLHEMFYC